jgi:L-lysine 6-transaminase
VDEEPQNVFRVSSRINSTWGGNLTDMVRCSRYLEIIEEDRLVDNAATVGADLRKGLEAIERESSGKLRNARGRGLMIAFDLETPELRDRAQERMLANGLLLLGCGVRSIRFRPPITISSDEVDEGMAIIRSSLERMATEKTAA